MADFESIKKRGERLRRQMDEALSPERAWDTVHQRNSPPKKYPTPNFLTNPGISDQRDLMDKRGSYEDEEDYDFYDYSDNEEDRKKEEEKQKEKDRRQHAIDDQDYLAKIRELEKRKKADELRDKINQDAHHNLLIHQINQTRTVDPFARQPDPPLVLQLYLRIHSASYLNPRNLPEISEFDQRKISDLEVFRNSFVQYKDFPKGKTQRTQIIRGTNNPTFNYKAYFGVIVREDIFKLLSKFFFLFEVWDSSTKNEIVGFCKLSLS